MSLADSERRRLAEADSFGQSDQPCGLSAGEPSPFGEALSFPFPPLFPFESILCAIFCAWLVRLGKNLFRTPRKCEVVPEELLEPVVPAEALLDAEEAADALEAMVEVEPFAIRGTVPFPLPNG